MKRFLVLFLLLSGYSSGILAGAHEVTFVGGGRMSAEAIEQRGDLVYLTLAAGGVLAIRSDRIVKISSTGDPIAPEPPAPLPAASPEAPELDAGEEADGGGPHGQPEAFLQEAGEVSRRMVLAMIGEAAERHGVDAELLRCLIEVESGFDPRAVSSKGAMGLAQLMPGTARELGVSDPFDPAQSVDAAARLLGELLRRSKGGFVEALAAYNAGRGAVNQYGGLPPYGETIRYVEKILTIYASR